MNGEHCLAVAVVLAALLCGCETQTIRSPGPQVPVYGGTTNAPAGGGTGGTVTGPQVDVAVDSDPSAINLDNISGALLTYYMQNHRLPEKLEELLPYAETGVQLQFISPASHQPYVYVPHGLGAVGKSTRIIVYDPAPTQTGYRRCIEMNTDYTKPGAPISLRADPIPEKLFQTYQPIGPP